MVLMGKTGMTAALSQYVLVFLLKNNKNNYSGPLGKDMKERYIFYIFPHIGVSSSGVVGKLKRPGIDEDSGVCGALVAMHNELLKGEIKVELDPLDIEQSLLKQKLIKHIKFGILPSLVELTKIAHHVALHDLQVLIREVLEKSGKKIDYAVITGVQVHTTNCDFITPDEEGGCYVVVDGKRTEIAFPNIENEFYKQVLAKQQQKKLERAAAAAAAAQKK